MKILCEEYSIGSLNIITIMMVHLMNRKKFLLTGRLDSRDRAELHYRATCYVNL